MAYDALKVLPLSTAFELVFKILKTNDLSVKEESMLEALILSCPQISDGGTAYIMQDDLHNFCGNFIRSLRENDGSFLYRQKGYKGRLVDIEEFVESKDYLNAKGSLRPVVKYELQDIIDKMDNTREVVLTGCVSGDTIIPINRQSFSKKGGCRVAYTTIKELYVKFNNLDYSKCDHRIKIKALSLTEEGIRYNQIEEVFYNGKKEVYEVITEAGKSITCTLKHRFRTSTGDYIPLSELKCGDFITCRAPSKKVGKGKLHRLQHTCHIENCEVHLEKITSIVYAGEQEVYDLQMADPFNNYIQSTGIITHNSTSWGKTHLARELMKYILYKLSMLHDPQYQYDLAPGSSIVIVLQAVSFRLSKKVLFNPIIASLTQSKYFTQNFPFNKQVTSELQFPNQIYITPVSGSELAALGENVYAGIMSEVNYWDVVENSKQMSMKGLEDTTFDQALVAYTNLIQRLKNRFQTYGKIPGVLVLDSATNYPGDFLSKKAEEAKWDNQIHVIRHMIWDTMPADRFSGKKFLVEVGTIDRHSRIISDKESAIPEAEILEVPEEYRTDFERDIEAALRDCAGLATGHRRAFMPFKDAIIDACTVHEAIYNNQKLFTEDSIDLNNHFVGPLEWDLLINNQYLEQLSFNAQADFCMHIDLGLSQDRTGLIVGHIQDYKSMPSTSFYSRDTNTFTEVSDMDAPIICFDGILHIFPPTVGDLNVDFLKGFMLYLCKKLNIKAVTMDSHQHVSFKQAISSLKGVRWGTVSTITSVLPYMELKTCYVEGRIIHQKHDAYIDEVLFLEYDPKKQLVRAIANKHDDLSDAGAGVVNVLLHKFARYRRSHRGANSYKKEVVPAHRQLVISKL